MKKITLIAIIGLLSFSFTLSGCSSTYYLWQAARGQAELFNKSKPIEDVLKDPLTPPLVKDFLVEVEEIKSFGVEQGLKKSKNYTEYVDLKRQAVVWVVSASDRLEFKPKIWEFPIAGSFNYIGWFSREDAIEFSKKIEKEDLDVDVRGSSAYSTLGWFRDPILSTMLPQDKARKGSFVEVVLHESVHASFYLDNQSYFNESIAEFVSQRLTEQYLKKKDKSAYENFESHIKKSDLLNYRIQETYQKLDAIYRSENLSNEEKKEQKELLLSSLQKEINFPRPINNATLIQWRTYGVGEKEFQSLFDFCQAQWPCFWEHIKKINVKSFKTLQQENIGEVILNTLKT